MKISTRTRLFALLGDPVSHSLSPIFQNAAFRAAGLDAVYLTLNCSTEAVPTLMYSLAGNGGGGNVTVPHKQIAAGQGRASQRVTDLGAANVFAADSSGMLVTENSDVDGVLHSLKRIQAPATAWLVTGTGGGARAVVGAAAERGAALAFRSRSLDAAARMAAFAAELGVEQVSEDQCEVAINTTPLGLLNGDPLPLELRQFPGIRWVFDLVYRPMTETHWVAVARASGCTAIDGREMLLAQGAAAWRLWFPGVTPSMEVMRAALRES